ncbi:hypothetical protein G647_08306 [Cladophialophora carrionii CBS 160.54]|uniref:Uncharacterized protein n=1 Tax=Cladophialophora carrionii CBS 160.54 TaxID=1279043 RepID=V9D2Q3_9EURO|nr:uncharacterized protein G647_08306 [Cladophialophora carrionii CBS 160.54]ETI20272.1 hypothetical protein G647_08306 [Cladophialophora carrionii CBS 160.54]
MFMPLRKRRCHGRQGVSGSEGSASTGRGRPMKHASLLKPPRKTQTQRAEFIHRRLNAEASTPTTHTLSTLESLPVEVFEQIFFHCLELNLPRASPYLARALSRRTIYAALVLFAYYESESAQSQVETEHFLPAAYRRITKDERVRLQEGILRCRWFTLELFESCLPALSRLAMFECWHRERQVLEAKLEQESCHTETAARFPGPASHLPALDARLEMESYYKARKSYYGLKSENSGPYGTNTGQGYQAGLTLEDISETDIGPVNRDGYLPFIAIPTSRHEDGEPAGLEGRSILSVRALSVPILRGAPWTDAKIKLLQYFRQGLRHEPFDRSLFISAKALFDGMASAIVEGNETALLVLLELHDTVVKRPAPTRKEIGSHGEVITPPLNVLPLKLFHLVCRLESSTRMMSLLLRGGVESIPYDDEVITRWAMHTKAKSLSDEEVSMARWVLGYMEDTGFTNSQPGDRPSQARGSKLVSHVYPRPDGLTFTREIGYICLVLPTSSLWTINPTNALGDE